MSSYDDFVNGENPYEEWFAALEAERLAMQSSNEPWWVMAAEPKSERSGPQRSERSGEAVSGITAPSTSHDCWQVSGGVDFLEVTCWGHFDVSYAQIEPQLASAWQSAASGGHNRRVEVEGATLVLREKGFRWGNTFFGFVGEYDGITYALRRSDARGDFVAKVQIGSVKLMRDGHRAAWAEALRTLRAFGVVVSKTNVSRIDLCVDLPGVGVAPFVDAVMKRRCITRASDTHYWQRADGEWGGVGLGRRKGGVYLRIYDKLEELKAHPEESEAKRHVLIERRWGVLPSIASRLEFQIAGAWMKERWADCSEVDQVFDKLGALMQYLTSSFFRMVDGEVDREHNNQQRAETAPLWSDVVVSAFKNWIDVEAVPLLKMQKKAVDRSRVGRRLVSAALSVAAMTPGAARDLQSLLQLMCNTAIRFLQDDEWKDKLQRKVDELDCGASRGVFTFEECDGPEFGSYLVTVDDLPNYHLGVRRMYVPAGVGSESEVPF